MPSLSMLSNLIAFSDCDVLLDSQRPVYMEDVLVQRQHEHDEDKEGVEHGKVEHSHVPELLQAFSDFFLGGKEVLEIVLHLGSPRLQ